MSKENTYIFLKGDTSYNYFGKAGKDTRERYRLTLNNVAISDIDRAKLNNEYDNAGTPDQFRAKIAKQNVSKISLSSAYPIKCTGECNDLAKVGDGSRVIVCIKLATNNENNTVAMYPIAAKVETLEKRRTVEDLFEEVIND